MASSLDVHAFHRLNPVKKLDNLHDRVNKIEICELPQRMQEAETEIEIIKARLHDQ